MRDLKSDELSHVYGAGGQPPDGGKKKRFGHSTSKKHRTSHKRTSRKKFTKKCR